VTVMQCPVAVGASGLLCGLKDAFVMAVPGVSEYNIEVGPLDSSAFDVVRVFLLLLHLDVLLNAV
jgi:hypothetical protein